MELLRLADNFDLYCLEPFGVVIECRATGTYAVNEANPTYIKSLLDTFRVVVLRGFKNPGREELSEVAATIVDGHSKLLAWDFGVLMELKVQRDAANYLFSDEAVPLHWDGAFHTVPSYLFFHCVKAPGLDARGRTLFVDTNRVWNAASDDERQTWRQIELEFETEKLAHYGGNIRAPLVGEHPALAMPILRFAEPVTTRKNPVRMTVHGGEQASEKYHALRARMYSDEFMLRHEWQDGDILIADNHALVHGRESFEQAADRHIRRVQLL